MSSNLKYLLKQIYVININKEKKKVMHIQFVIFPPTGAPEKENCISMYFPKRELKYINTKTSNYADRTYYHSSMF